MAERRKISSVLADADGPLVTEAKIPTERARDVVNALEDAGIRFAMTSGRPPRGMTMRFGVLDIEPSIAGFSGGLFVKRGLSILEQKTVPADVARQAIDLMRARGLRPVIDVDGGENAATAAAAAAAGVTAIVAGSAIFGTKDCGNAIAEIRARGAAAAVMS
jgi:hydroxymethylpyrimidine pyrophosphatase-like HAD family hydrolase